MTYTQHLVFLVNPQGEQAAVASLVIEGSTTRGAVQIAKRHGFSSFNVVKRVTRPQTYTDQRTHAERLVKPKENQ